MKANDFMPDGDVIAGIKADLERYEAERARVHRAVMWRVPVFLGLFLLAVSLNEYIDPRSRLRRMGA